MKRIKMEHLDDSLQWKIGRRDMRFEEYQDGILVGIYDFTVDELLRLILNHFELEPRKVLAKSILQKKKH